MSSQRSSASIVTSKRSTVGLTDEPIHEICPPKKVRSGVVADAGVAITGINPSATTAANHAIPSGSDMARLMNRTRGGSSRE